MDSECINSATINVGEVSAAVDSPDTFEAGKLKHYVSDWQQLISDLHYRCGESCKNSHLKYGGSNEPQHVRKKTKKTKKKTNNNKQTKQQQQQLRTRKFNE